MKKIKKLLLGSVVFAFVALVLASCSKDPVDSYDVLEKPAVTQNDTIFTWNALEDVTGYVVSINDEVKGIGNPVINAEAGNFCQYQLDTSSLANGTYSIKFASYIFTEKGKTELSEWSSVFTLVWPKEYVVATPAVYDNGDYGQYYWPAIDGVDGYIVSIDGEETNIGNPVSTSEYEGSYCSYEIDPETLGEGKHVVMFASYVYDEAGKMIKSAWTKEFDIFNIVPLEQAYIYEYYGYGFELYCPTDTIKLVLNDTIEATYTDPYEDYIGDDYIKLDKFEFTEELVDKTSYIVKAYSVNEYGECNEDPYTFVFYYEENIPYETPIGFSLAGMMVGFVFEEELDYPVFLFKVNDKEYTINYDDYEVTSLMMDDLIGYLSEEEYKEINAAIMNGSVEMSLKIISSDIEYLREASEYSNVVKVESPVTDEMIEEQLDDTFEVQFLSSELGMLAVSEDLTTMLPEGSVTYKLTVNGTVVEPSVAAEDSDGYMSSMYQIADYYVFGNNDIQLSVTWDAFDIKDYVVYKDSFSIGSQVYEIGFEDRDVYWYGSSYVSDYKVQVLGTDGTVKATYNVEADTMYYSDLLWDTAEYTASDSFVVNVVPVLNGKDGTPSVDLAVERPSAPTTSVIEEEYGYLVFTPEDGKTLQVEIVSNNYVITSDSSNDEDYPIEIDLYDLYDYTSFDIELTYLGNGVRSVDSVTTVLECVTADVLTYTIKDGEKIKVSGVPTNAKLQVNYYDDSYDTDEDGYFDLLAYADAEGEYYIDINAKVNSFSTTSVNVFAYPLYFDLDTTDYGGYRAVAPYFGDYYTAITEFAWDSDPYNKYEWTLSSVAYDEEDEEVLTQISTGSLVGNTLDIPQDLTVGMYKFEVKTLGNGMVFNSETSSVYYEVLDSSLLTATASVENLYTNYSYFVVNIKTDKIATSIKYGYTDSIYTYRPTTVSANYNEEDSTIIDSYDYMWNSSTVYNYATNDYYDVVPYVTYAYAGDADYCNALPQNISIDMQSYRMMNSESADGYIQYYYLYGLNDVRPTELVPYYYSDSLSCAPIIEASTSDSYDYDVYTYMDYTGGENVGKHEYADGYYYEFAHIILDYTNASGLFGIDANRFATTTTGPVTVTDVYVLNTADVLAYLNTYLGISDYAYYTDAACTTLLTSGPVATGTTIYVGPIQAAA